jgi:hypothetical protein
VTSARDARIEAKEREFLRAAKKRYQNATKKGNYHPDDDSNGGSDSEVDENATPVQSDSEDELMPTDKQKSKRKLEEIAQQPEVKRVKIDTVTVDTLGHIRYVANGDPFYTPADRPGAGGMRSTAILGPGGVLNVNSKADRTALPNIDAAEGRYGKAFRAGHLLNACFGGSNTDPDNLTALTASTNTSHKSFDENVKRAGGALVKAYEAMMQMGLDVDTIDYGISVAVGTDGWWTNDPTDPGYFVCGKLLCAADVVNVPVLAALEAQLDATHGVGNRLAGHQKFVQALQVAIDSVQGFVEDANDANEIPNV